MRKIIDFIKYNFYLRNLAKVIVVAILLILMVNIYLRIYTHHGQALSVPDLKGYSVEEAGEILKKKKLKFEVEDSVYVTEAKGGVIVDQLPKPEFKVKKNRVVFLTINAHTPEKVIMTNVVGYSYRNAKAELVRRGLDIGELIFVPDIAKNMVLKQKLYGYEIKEGDTIYKGSKIDLIIGDGLSNERVTVPDLLSLSIKEAKEKLNESYLNLSEIYDNSVETWQDSSSALIFKQKPESNWGARLPMGSVVDVWATIDSTKMPGYDSLAYLDELKQNNLYAPEDE